jgi:pimeloyl-ACP methyl ester carboxylesterase
MVSQRTTSPTPLKVLTVRESTAGEPGVIRLSFGTDVDLPGAHYSLLFDQLVVGAAAGHARVGAVLRQSPPGFSPEHRWVERELIGVDRGVLRAGSRGRMTGWWYPDVTALDEDAELIELQLDGGPARAWIVRANHDDDEPVTHWAIHVHGRGAQLEETLRGVRVALQSGRVSMVMTYRGDVGAPAALNDRYGFGAAEWRDVSAAMAEASRRGALSITLFGWSMGGTACLLAAARSLDADLIDGIVLDSPALNWRALTVHHTRRAGVPGLFGWIGGWLLEIGLVRSGVPGGIPVRRLTPSAFAAHLAAPVLIHCGPEDTFVPEKPALEFAALCPELVTVHRVPLGEHVRLWNVEPERWDDATLTFLRRLQG